MACRVQKDQEGTITTIAYRDGTLAGDTRVTLGGEEVWPGHYRKVWRLRNGYLLGVSGNPEKAKVLKQALEKGHDIPDMRGQIDAIRVSPEGKVESYSGTAWLRERHEFVAIGSGGGFARAAMMAGASAKEAVRIACKLDTASGGKVLNVRLKEKNDNQVSGNVDRHSEADRRADVGGPEADRVGSEGSTEGARGD